MKNAAKTRLKEVLERLELTPLAFAKIAGISKHTASSWAYNKDANPQTREFQEALASIQKDGRQLSQFERLFFWLPEGRGSPPAWLRDWNEDPFAPEIELPSWPPRPAPAMPQGAAEKIVSARKRLRGEVIEARGRASGAVLRALADLDEGFRLLPGLDPDEERDTNDSAASRISNPSVGSSSLPGRIDDRRVA